jgi:hypothetical protein
MNLSLRELTTPVRRPKLLVGTAAAAMLVGVVGSGLAPGSANAQIGGFPIPDYHWCPGQFWDPGWGFNWDGADCHDDHHADRWGNDHSHDWFG